MGFGWGFGRDERLGSVPEFDIKIRSTLNISTMTTEDFDGGVELGCGSLQQRPPSHGSKVTSVAQSLNRSILRVIVNRDS